MRTSFPVDRPTPSTLSRPPAIISLSPSTFTPCGLACYHDATGVARTVAQGVAQTVAQGVAQGSKPRRIPFPQAGLHSLSPGRVAQPRQLRWVNSVASPFLQVKVEVRFVVRTSARDPLARLTNSETYPIARLGAFTPRRSHLDVHTSMFTPRCSHLDVHTSMFTPRCSGRSSLVSRPYWLRTGANHM